MNQQNEHETNNNNDTEENKKSEDEEEVEEDSEPLISEDELELSPRRKMNSSKKNINELVLNNKNIQHVLKLPYIFSNNQEIYFLNCEKNLTKCKQLIEENLNDSKLYNEYAIQMSGFININNLDVSNAISCFEIAHKLNRQNVKHLMNLGRINYLFGNHSQALTYFTKIIQMAPNNWKAYCWEALTLYYQNKKSYEGCNKAIEVLLTCPSASKNSEILSLIAFFCREKGDFFSASEALKKASDIDISNIDLLKELGYDYLKLGSEELAFGAFGKALTFNNSHIPSIVGASYIIQNNGDYDVALTKYRHAVNICNYSGAIWNNIGMCFYGKGKYITAISCLKKADYLIPQNWEVLFNIGLAYNGLTQYASAYQYISAALNLQPKNTNILEALGVVLTHLGDINNARKAFQKAISIDKGKTPGFYLNFAIFEYKNNLIEESKTLLGQYFNIIENGSKVDIETSYTANRLRKVLEKLN
uniref:TPR_REGION domain-containing protein n=1 Tax=Strongyloides stercoralis TaxID=6248 RepID=A0A0K0E476_STRER